MGPGWVLLGLMNNQADPVVHNPEIEGEYCFIFGSHEALNVRIQFFDLVDIMAEESEREKEWMKEHVNILFVILEFQDIRVSV